MNESENDFYSVWYQRYTQLCFGLKPESNHLITLTDFLFVCWLPSISVFFSVCKYTGVGRSSVRLLAPALWQRKGGWVSGVGKRGPEFFPYKLSNAQFWAGCQKMNTKTKTNTKWCWQFWKAYDIGYHYDGKDKDKMSQRTNPCYICKGSSGLNMSLKINLQSLEDTQVR